MVDKFVLYIKLPVMSITATSEGERKCCHNVEHSNQLHSIAVYACIKKVPVWKCLDKQRCRNIEEKYKWRWR